jgi:hypothetical protein
MCRTRARNFRSIDLRVRARSSKRLGLVELKWCPGDLRVANKRARGCLKTYATCAHPSTVWWGPHPNRRKSAGARYVGTLGISAARWALRLYRRSQVVAHLAAGRKIGSLRARATFRGRHSQVGGEAQGGGGASDDSSSTSDSASSADVSVVSAASSHAC